MAARTAISVSDFELIAAFAVARSRTPLAHRDFADPLSFVVEGSIAASLERQAATFTGGCAYRVPFGELSVNRWMVAGNWAARKRERTLRDGSVLCAELRWRWSALRICTAGLLVARGLAHACSPVA